MEISLSLSRSLCSTNTNHNPQRRSLPATEASSAKNFSKEKEISIVFFSGRKIKTN
jgi:hypothetical protein